MSTLGTFVPLRPELSEAAKEARKGKVTKGTTKPKTTRSHKPSAPKTRPQASRGKRKPVESAKKKKTQKRGTAKPKTQRSRKLPWE